MAVPRSSSADGSRPARRAGAAAGAAAVAVGVAVAARANGAFYVSTWAPLALGLCCAVAALAVVGRRPSRAVGCAAALIVLLGAWSVVSTAWGGLPAQAWRAFDLSLVGASALLLGSMAAPSLNATRVVLAGVLSGAVVLSGEVLTRAATAAVPPGWLHGRVFDGPLGHHNAQAALGVATLPLALAAAASARAWVRVGGMACAGILLAVVVLTQSRAAALALVAAALTQVAWSRNVAVTLRLASLVPAAFVLVRSLEQVDAATASGRPDAAALQRYAVSALVVTAALAVTGIVRLPATVPRRSLAAAATSLVVIVTLVAVGLAVSSTLPPITNAALVSDPRDLAPGATRFASFGLNGRQDAWRVAAAMIADDPVLGAGQGQFARVWTERRRLPELYILQPHSLELELLAELGPVGLLLLLLSVAFAFAGLRHPRRGAAPAAAAAGLVALLVHASLDWVWWFPGVVAPVLLAVGAAAGGRASAPGAMAKTAKVAVVGALLGATVAFALPYVANAQRARATRLLERDPGTAASDLRFARILEPWDPDSLSAEGRLAEAEGRDVAAAALYEAAARRSQRPWIEYYRAARALRGAAPASQRLHACSLAISANPLEQRLRSGACRP